MNEGQGTIHDLGYEPYRGPRLAQTRRFWIIARNVIAVAWRGKWGVKAPVLLSVMVVMAATAIMWVARAAQRLSHLTSGGAQVLRVDAVVFQSFNFYGFLGFLLATTVGCATVADDLKMGAFQFYFSRPIRPRDYVAGKVAGLALVVGIPMFGVPVALAILRLLLAEDLAEAGRVWMIVPRAAALGLVGTAAYVLPAAGMGALMQKRAPAQALFAVYYLVVGSLAKGMAMGLRAPQLRLLALDDNIRNVGSALFGIDRPGGAPPVWQSVAATAALGLAGWVILWRRVRRAETSGLGGG